MGVLLTASKDTEAFQDTTEEVMRLVKNSELVSFITAETSPELDIIADTKSDISVTEEETAPDLEEMAKVPTSKLAQKHKMKTADLIGVLTEKGLLEDRNGKPFITLDGKKAGGEYKKGQYGGYFLWPVDLEI